MKKKIQKKVSPFLFFLLTIGLAVPGVAQREVKNERQDRINRSQRVQNNTPKITASRNANYGKTLRTPRVNNNTYAYNGRRGNSSYSTARRGSNSKLVYRTRVRNNRAGVRVYGNPVGFRVRYLPKNVVRFNRGGSQFFYNCGDFYVATQFGYRTIQAPIGAQIRVLPRRARTVYYGRDAFYQIDDVLLTCLLYTSPSPRDKRQSRMPSSA